MLQTVHGRLTPAMLRDLKVPTHRRRDYISLPISHEDLVLGTWQAIYLREFDGPRQRTLPIQVLGEGASGGPS